MSDLILVGASGLAREVLAVERSHGTHDRIAVVDDDPRTWGDLVGDAPVLGGLDEVGRHPGAEVVVCIGGGQVRRDVVRRLADVGVRPDRYARVVHPSVDVPEGCAIGPGCVLLAQVALTAAVSLGSHVVVMPNATLTHDDVVDDFATLCAGVSLGGGVLVGAAAYVGMNASVREGVVVGAGSVVGMGSVQLCDVPPGEVWAGVPTHRLHQGALRPKENA
jgi:sugar O-acyltransferase (sialic acid O-acetyltransferase NeuD family)